MSVFEASRTYVIAEAGVNHNGKLDWAHRLIDVAAKAGADAVKFQTFRTESIAAASAEMADYQKANTGSETSQAEMLKALELSFDQFAALADHAKDAGIDFLSTAFDLESLGFLDRLGVRLLKIPSGEITNPDLVGAVGRAGRPVVMSTGMADLGEVERALGWLREAGAGEICLLHCVSDYPADPADANLAAMDTMRAAFGLPVGWSDHTLGDAISIAAVARGARVIEKHFTLDTALPGPDHKASLDPEALTRMVAAIRAVEAAIGDGVKRPTAAELKVAAVARRSIVARRALAAGERIGPTDLVYLRPGTGIPPADAHYVVGRTAARAIPAGTVLALADLV